MSLISALNSIIKNKSKGGGKLERKKDQRHGNNTFLNEDQALPQLPLENEHIHKYPQLVTYDDFYPEERSLKPWFSGPHLGPAPPKLPPYSPVRGVMKFLDMTRITNRIIVTGLPWDNSNDRNGHRVNSRDLALFLQERHKSKFLLFNLAGRFPSYKRWNNARFIRYHSISEPDEDNVALVHCTNGVGRTSIAVSCYLRFASMFSDTNTAFEYFCSRRTSDDISWITVSQTRYIQYFNNILLLSGSIPNPYPLHIHRIIFHGIPRFDSFGSCVPGIEIYLCGKLVYTATLGKEHRTETCAVFMDESSIVFRIPEDSSLNLDRDIQVRVFHCPDPDNPNSRVITMINFSFHTGFMPGGVIRVARDDLELSRRDILEGRFDPDFSMDLVLTNAVTQEDVRSGKIRPLTYQKLLNSEFVKCLSKTARYHTIKPDEGAFAKLSAMGCDRWLASFVLQRTNNELQAAYEYLSFLLRTSPDVRGLIKEPSVPTSIRSPSVGYTELAKRHPRASSLPSQTASQSRNVSSNSERLGGTFGLGDEGSNAEASGVEYKGLPDRPQATNSVAEPNDLMDFLKSMRAKRTEIRRSLSQQAEEMTREHTSASEKDRFTEPQPPLRKQSSRPSQPVREEGNPSPWPAPPSDYSSILKKVEGLSQMEGDLMRTSEVSSLAVSSSSMQDMLEDMDRAIGLLSEAHRLARTGESTVEFGPEDTADARKVAELHADGVLLSLEDEKESPKSLENEPLPSIVSAPPPPPPPPVPGPPPPPPPGIPPNISTEEDEKKKRVRAKLHWNEIRSVAALKDSVWTEISGIDDHLSPDGSPKKKRIGSGIALDVQRFEELFCIVPGDEKKGLIKPKMVVKQQYTNLLDLRRANNVSIGLSMFARRGLMVSQVLAAIDCLDSDTITLDDLISLQNLQPTLEERSIIDKYISKTRKQTDPPLAPAEDFMSETMKDPDFSEKIVGFIFKLQAPVEANDLEERCSKIIGVCETIKNSERLKTLLKTVLQLGNLTNYQYGTGASSYRPWMGKEARALGFKVDGLARLKDVKSADGKWNLMSFLVDMVDQSKPEVLDVTDEFQDMRIVRQYDLKELCKQFFALEATLDHLKAYRYFDEGFSDRLQVTLNGMSDRLKQVRLLFDEASNKWTDAARYLGEDLDEYNPFLPSTDAFEYNPNRKLATHLFVTLDLFFQAFEEAAQANKQQKEQERRKQARLDRDREAKEKREAQKSVSHEEKLDQNEAKDMVKRFSVLQLTIPSPTLSFEKASPIAEEEVLEY